MNRKVVDEMEFEYWKHKVFDRSFEEFQKELHSNQTQDVTMSKDEVKTTIIKSNEILSNFKPN